MILWLFKINSPSVRKARTKILVDEMTGNLRLLQNSLRRWEKWVGLQRARLGHEHNVEAG